MPHKINTGIYADDIILLRAFLSYMNQFKTIGQMREKTAETHREHFNQWVVEELSDYFDRRRNKLPIEPVKLHEGEYYFNRRGSKVYYDSRKQSAFDIEKDGQIIRALSVGIDHSGCALMTVEENGEAVCYRLPPELDDWAWLAVGFANMGIRHFPASVRFSKKQRRLIAEIL